MALNVPFHIANANVTWVERLPLSPLSGREKVLVKVPVLVAEPPVMDVAHAMIFAKGLDPIVYEIYPSIVVRVPLREDSRVVHLCIWESELELG